MEDFTIALQAFVAAAIFFVWVVRYPNIINEFKQYALPEWLRDLVGVLKLTFALLLLIGINHRRLAIAGAAGIALLMGAAVVTHLRVRNPPFKMLPALALLLSSVMIAVINYQLLEEG